LPDNKHSQKSELGVTEYILIHLSVKTTGKLHIKIMHLLTDFWIGWVWVHWYCDLE